MEQHNQVEFPGAEDEALGIWMKEFKPQIKEDDRPKLDGIFLVVFNKATLEDDKFNPGEKKYSLEIQVTETLSGKGFAGQKLWKRYQKNQEGIAELINDMATAGHNLVLEEGITGMENSLAQLVNLAAYVRAWTTQYWKIDGEDKPIFKNQYNKLKADGVDVTGYEEKVSQKFVFLTKKDMEKKLAKMKKAENPF